MVWWPCALVNVRIWVMWVGVVGVAVLARSVPHRTRLRRAVPLPRVDVLVSVLGVLGVLGVLAVCVPVVLRLC